MLSEGGPGAARDGCGGDTYRQRASLHEWKKPHQKPPPGGRLPPRGRWQGEALTDEGKALPHFIKPGFIFEGSPPHPPPAGGTLSKQERAGAASAAGRGAVPGRFCVPPHTRHACGVPPSPKERVFQAIYASRSDSFLTIREVMRNSTATKAKKPHWALVVSEVAMKS